MVTPGNLSIISSIKFGGWQFLSRLPNLIYLVVHITKYFSYFLLIWYKHLSTATDSNKHATSLQTYLVVGGPSGQRGWHSYRTHRTWTLPVQGRSVQLHNLVKHIIVNQQLCSFLSTKIVSSCVCIIKFNCLNVCLKCSDKQSCLIMSTLYNSQPPGSSTIITVESFQQEFYFVPLYFVWG